MKFIVGSSIIFSEDEAICIINVERFDKFNRPLFEEYPYAKSSEPFTLRKPKYSKATMTFTNDNIKEVIKYLMKSHFTNISILNYQMTSFYSALNILEEKYNKSITVYSTNPVRSILEFEGDDEVNNGLFSHFPTGEWRKFLNATYPEGSVNDEVVKIEQLYEKEIEEYEVYPQIDKTFTAFHLTPIDKIRVVLIGQDPYHDENQAMGLSFSVPKGVRVPSSLRNIYKEMLDEGFVGDVRCGDLTYLAKQGVFLINTALTVRANNAGSHSKWWKTFTNHLMNYLVENVHNAVYILLGRHAQEYRPIIERNQTCVILETSHPSGFSANKGFLGSNIFKECNDHLDVPIKWIK